MRGLRAFRHVFVIIAFLCAGLAVAQVGNQASVEGTVSRPSPFALEETGR